MSFELQFHLEARKEWTALDESARRAFKKKLADRLQRPRVLKDKLSGHPDRYKIKLRRVGYRLVYEVRDATIVVVVVARGRRDKNAAYRAAAAR